MIVIEPCYVELGAFLKRQRQRCQLSQDRAADLLGMKRGKVEAIEAGRQRVYLHDANRIREVFSASAVKLLIEAALRQEEERILDLAEAIRARREGDGQ